MRPDTLFFSLSFLFLSLLFLFSLYSFSFFLFLSHSIFPPLFIIPTTERTTTSIIKEIHIFSILTNLGREKKIIERERKEEKEKRKGRKKEGRKEIESNLQTNTHPVGPNEPCNNDRKTNKKMVNG